MELTNRPSVTVNIDTGEVTEENTGIFVKMYLENASDLDNIELGPIGVLPSILRRMDKDNRVTLYRETKTSIALEHKMLVNTISQYVSILCKHNILIRESRANYIVNNKYFGR
jgi:hypothetical protein